MKKVSLAIDLFIVFLLFAGNVEASYTFNRTPSGNGTYSSMQVDFSVDDITEVCNPIGGGGTQIGQYAIGIFNTESVGGSVTPTFRTTYHDVSELSFSETVNFDSAQDIYSIWVTCRRNNGVPSNQTTLETSATPIFFTVIPTPPSSNIWGSNNGFFGTTTPIEALATIRSGVVNTGGSLWPLLIFLGVGLAFVIGNMLVGFIRSSAKTETKKEDFIYHTPDDLEFKRNYGKDK